MFILQLYGNLNEGLTPSETRRKYSSERTLYLQKRCGAMVKIAHSWSGKKTCRCIRGRYCAQKFGFRSTRLLIVGPQRKAAKESAVVLIDKLEHPGSRAVNPPCRSIKERWLELVLGAD